MSESNGSRSSAGPAVGLAAAGQRGGRGQYVPAHAPTAPSCVLVVFGASGDLTKRLLVPALYNLARTGLLDSRCPVIGVDRVERTDQAFRAYLTSAIHDLVGRGDGEFSAESLDMATWAGLAARMRYVTGTFEDPRTYERIDELIAEYAAATSGNALFYLATPPDFFGVIIDQLHTAGLIAPRGQAFRRIIIEKPFGSDLASARSLNDRILRAAAESQVYRIDHFLGKETVRNLMVLRFANGIFEPIWNREHIDHVQITAAETLGVGHRGGYYDRTGALRDMVPNHLFQLLAMMAMEAPTSFAAEAVRSEKAKVLEAVRRWSPTAAATHGVRAQYGAGRNGDQEFYAYRTEPDVAPDSATETFVALELMIDNWRWAGVPFYLRTGKALAARRTEIAVQFKGAPPVLFRDLGGGGSVPNFMVLRIQPDEGISLRFAAKVPGPDVRLASVDMDFRYVDFFNAEPSTGYETLLYDCLIGDATLFQRSDYIENGWAIVQPFLEAWKDGGALEVYPAGSNGPGAADALLGRENRQWLPITASDDAHARTRE